MKRRLLSTSAVTFALFAVLFGPAMSAENADAGKRLLAAVPPLGDQSIGKPDAPVVMVEYASATCPHCAEFHKTLLPQLKAEYIETGKVRFIFREFPLDQLALAAFMLARCVPEDKYFATIDLMFRRQETWMKGDREAELLKITNMAGLDKAGFDACLKREELAKAIVESSRKDAKEFGIKGTPAIFVNGQLIDGHKEMAEVKAALDKAIAGE